MSAKASWINYIAVTAFIPLIIIVQTGLWPSFWKGIAPSFFNAPIYLWIPYLIYWTLWRTTKEAVIIIYLLSFMIAAAGTQPAGRVLFIHCLIFLTVLFFKRVYYTSLRFFSAAVGLSLLTLPLLIGLLSLWLDGRFDFPGVRLWLMGGVLTWVLAFPLLFCLQAADHLTSALKPVKRNEQ